MTRRSQWIPTLDRRRQPWSAAHMSRSRAAVQMRGVSMPERLVIGARDVERQAVFVDRVGCEFGIAGRAAGVPASFSVPPPCAMRATGR